MFNRNSPPREEWHQQGNGSETSVFRPQGESSGPIINGVIKYSHGLIRNRRQANYFLIAFIVLGIVVFLLLIFGSRKSSAPLPPNAKVIFPPGEPPRLQEPLYR
jgi:hypothetical protein